MELFNYDIKTASPPYSILIDDSGDAFQCLPDDRYIVSVVGYNGEVRDQHQVSSLFIAFAIIALIMKEGGL